MNIKNNEWIEWIKALVIALVIAYMVKYFLFEIVQVEGDSMVPTLQDKDRLIATKIEYYFNDPDYGDIIIFKYPSNPKINYIKRIIAKEGDTVEIKGNKLYLNNKEIMESYINDKTLERFSKIKVPENSYFVLGDNRNNSKDSRSPEVGFLKKEDIQGKAVLRILPLTSIKILK